MVGGTGEDITAANAIANNKGKVNFMDEMSYAELCKQLLNQINKDMSLDEYTRASLIDSVAWVRDTLCNEEWEDDDDE